MDSGFRCLCLMLLKAGTEELQLYMNGSHRLLFGAQTAQEVLYVLAHWMVVERVIGPSELNGVRVGVVLSAADRMTVAQTKELRSEAAAAKNDTKALDQFVEFLNTLVEETDAEDGDDDEETGR